MDDRAGLNAREQRAWRGFIEMNLKLRERVERSLVREANMSGTDYTVLVALSEAPDGRMRAFELGATISWEKSRLSQHLARMAQRGLVERRSSTDDKRGMLIILTPAGRTAIEDAAPRHREHVRRYFLDALTPAQQEALSGISDAVLAHLAALPEDGPPADGAHGHHAACRPGPGISVGEGRETRTRSEKSKSLSRTIKCFTARRKRATRGSRPGLARFGCGTPARRQGQAATGAGTERAGIVRDNQDLYSERVRGSPVPQCRAAPGG